MNQGSSIYIKCLPTNKINRVTVAIADSGVSMNDPFFKEAKIISRSFINSDPNVDHVGHGTECCKILYYDKHSKKMRELFKSIHLIVGQIINKKAIGNISDLVSCLRWMSEYFPHIIAIPSGRLNPDKTLEAVIKSLTPNTMIFAPVGNPFTGQKGPLYPANYENVFSVGYESFSDFYKSWDKKPTVIVSEKAFSSVGLNAIPNNTSYATMLAVRYACHNLKFHANPLV